VESQSLLVFKFTVLHQAQYRVLAKIDPDRHNDRYTLMLD